MVESIFAALLRPTFIALLLSVSCAATNAADGPNFVFILADDVGQECLGCYGGESYKTPNLDHLAETGIRFQQCYSMPVCHPTRLTLLTGKYPFRYGSVAWGGFPKDAEATTFARILSGAGYATAVAGKWQLTLLRDDPNHAARLGFQQSDLFGWHEGPRYYEPMIYRNGKVRTDTLGQYGPDIYVRSLIEFMKMNHDRPFLAFYPMALCHDVTDDLDKPVPPGPLGRYDSYAEMVAEMDRCVGRIVAAIDALKIRDKTVIMFVGDNGTPRKMISRADGNKLVRVPVVSQQNGREIAGGKGTLLDTGTRVPFIANWPREITAGQVVDDMIDMSDFWPTLLELTSVAPPSGLDVDGISFAGRLRVTNQVTNAREWSYSEGKKSRWVRTSKWKLYDDGRLFDMASDSKEAKPIDRTDDTETQRKARQQLEAVFKELIAAK